MDAGGECEQHERLFPLGGRGRIDHRLRRSVVVVDLDQVAVLEVQIRHVLRIHFDERVGPSIHDELVVLVQIRTLPNQVGPSVVDQEREFVLLGLLAGRLKAPPLRGCECRLAVLGIELSIGKKSLGPDDFFLSAG